MTQERAEEIEVALNTHRFGGTPLEYRTIRELLDALRAAEARAEKAEKTGTTGFEVGTDAGLELVFGLFSDSIHEQWTKDEITDAIEALRKQVAIAARSKG